MIASYLAILLGALLYGAGALALARPEFREVSRGLFGIGLLVLLSAPLLTLI